MATACSVSYDRLNIRPSATHNPHLRATHTRSTRHPQINAGAWGSVAINSRAKHPTINATCKEKGRERREPHRHSANAHTHLSTHFINFSISIEHPEISASREFLPGTGLHFLCFFLSLSVLMFSLCTTECLKLMRARVKKSSYVHVVWTDLPVSVQSPAPACSEAS